MSIQETIASQISDHAVVLYMKGNMDFPQCGFSAQAIAMLQACDVEFFVVDVLEDEGIRQGIKEFSSWPTIPQLYVNGEFIGGSDIMAELYESGELGKLLNSSTST